jgi:hypothetical protein
VTIYRQGGFHETGDTSPASSTGALLASMRAAVPAWTMLSAADQPDEGANDAIEPRLNIWLDRTDVTQGGSYFEAG